MATYTITIADKLQIAALTEARNEVNNQLANRPGPRNGQPQVPLEEMSGYLATNEEYLQQIIDRAVRSYVVKFGLSDDVITAKETELNALKAKLAQARS